MTMCQYLVTAPPSSVMKLHSKEHTTSNVRRLTDRNSEIRPEMYNTVPSAQSKNDLPVLQ